MFNLTHSDFAMDSHLLVESDEEQSESEFDSDEEAEIAHNAEKYVAVLEALLLSPISGHFGHPFNATAFTATTITDESALNQRLGPKAEEEMSTPNPNIGRAPPSVEEGDFALPAVCRHQQQQSATATAAEEAAPSLPVQTVTDCAQTSSVPQQVIVRQRPAVPPKPQLDVVRFSMAQARDELDLDSILTELLELESQLSGEAGDRLVLGLPSLPSQQSASRPLSNGTNNTVQMKQTAPVQQMAKRVQFQQAFPSGGDFCASPDADSAFGDSSSTESAHPPLAGVNAGLGSGRTGANSEFSSADSFRGSLVNTPSPTHQQGGTSVLNGLALGQHHQQNGGNCLQAGGGHGRPPSSTDSFTSSSTAFNKDEQQKKAKIREALEKMKEAKMKKVFVKIFLEDGSQRGLLVDERWSVAETMRQLSEKLNCALTPEHAIVEEYPHLHIKRIYEDHELVVENLEDWTSDSPNKLHFLRLPQKWAMFRQPQHFLLTERNRNDFPPVEANWDREQRQRLLDTYLCDDGTSSSRVPELEGWLLLKADGKKSWRRHYFVLRASGLYYVAKPGKPRGPTRDLQCLMSVFNNQLYTCTEWRKKYKAPSDWGFAIKHPRIQVKTSKYIKYICAEEEAVFLQWMTALRIIKNGCSTLYKNFSSSHSQMCPSSAGPSTPVRVEVPHVPPLQQQRLSALNFAQSPRQKPTSILGFSSPATMRASYAPQYSRTNGLGSCDSSRLASPVHVGFAFDQDHCNTIKRQPDSLVISSADTNMMNRSQQHQEQIRQRFLPSSRTNDIGSPTTSSSATLFEVNGAASHVVAESDSDEEQFPPPPSTDNSVMPDSVNYIESPKRMATISVAAPSCPPKPLSLSNNSTTRQISVARGFINSGGSGKTPPPPPPKRAEGTRIQSASNGSSDGDTVNVNPLMNAHQMDLMAELQLATSKQKMRLEQNL